ncbi:MAG: dNTP triphosphohydrolase [bacterium]
MHTKNKFYTDFDLTRLKESKRTDDYRSPFQIDRDRIIHSSEFRRLQGKTQVFLPGEYDFYRTRLTHSIEVAQIGRSICHFILYKEKDLFNDEYFIDPDLVESACLAHDLGHPPFGHAGERTLHRLMKPYGGFEGNAQTLRLIAETFYTDTHGRRGMNPTRAFLDSIIKYKSLLSHFDDPENHFLYEYQKEFIDFIFAGFEINSIVNKGDDLNSFQSIECQIMDWADDTAYAINDIVDSISGGFITINKLTKWAEDNPERVACGRDRHINEIIKAITEGNFKRIFGTHVGEFIAACEIEQRKTFLDGKTNRYKYLLKVDPSIIEQAELYKKIAVDLVFKSPHLKQMELKGDYMINKIFSLLEEYYITDVKHTKLLLDFTHKLIVEEKDKMNRARLVCDYIAGMTDSFAVRNYKRLFDPDYSSLVDLM